MRSTETHVKPKNYRILVLPSGGATGILSSSLLTELEKEVGTPIYQHFDEIWCSSIGSVIAAMLTTKKAEGGGVMPAAEVTEFLERTFSSFARAIGIRDKFKKKIPASILMRDTLIPIRILCAEVTRFTWGWPTQTRLRSFSSEEDGAVSLASAVASSCTVFPIHARAEPLRTSDGKIIYCVDAGCQVCTERCMNPLERHFQEFSKKIDPRQDSVAIYFISNGWVRLDPSRCSDPSITLSRGDGEAIQVKLFNIDVSLSSVLGKWEKNSRWGGLLKKIKSQHVLSNLAGAGVIPSPYLRAEVLDLVKNSQPYRAMLKTLALIQSSGQV